MQDNHFETSGHIQERQSNIEQQDQDDITISLRSRCRADNIITRHFERKTIMPKYARL